MKMEMINKHAVIHFIEKSMYFLEKDKYGTSIGRYVVDKNELMARINELMTLEVETKDIHAKWIGGDTGHCSVCGENEGLNYCSYCGAPFDLEEDEK